MTAEPTKDKYVHDKSKTWKESIKINFNGYIVPYNMYWNARAVLKIDSVYKQGKSYYPQAYVEECKYNNAEKKMQHI